MMPQQFNQYINVLTNNDWVDLEQIIERIQSYSPEIIEKSRMGDSRNESVNLDVIRFIMRKNNASYTLNDPYCSEIITILNRSHFLETINKHLKVNNLQILRMQFNLMKEGSFVGLHKDNENDSSYLATAVLRTHSNFSEGELVLYGKNKRIISQKNRTVFLMDSSIEHEVMTVKHGYRNSLIIVMGR